MLGKIIFYNQNEGKGIIVSEGVQYPFSIVSWVSDTAPNTNTTVSFELDETNSILSVGTSTAANSPQLPPPSLNDLKKQLSERLGQSSAPAPKPDNSQQPGAGSAANAPVPPPVPSLSQGVAPVLANFNAKEIMSTLGRESLAAQVLYIVAILALPFANKITSLLKPAVGTSLWDLTSDKLTPAFAGGFSMLFWISIVSILVPVFWKNKLAWLALLAPLATVVRGFFLINTVNESLTFSEVSADAAAKFISTVTESASHTAEMSSRINPSLEVALIPSYGLWVAGAAALIVALLGLLKFRQFS